MAGTIGTATTGAGRIRPGPLLDAWEQAADGPEPGRAAALVDALGLLEDAVRAPLADCDRAVLALQQLVFGDSAELVIDCATCGAPLEVDLELGPLVGQPVTAQRVRIESSAGPVVVRAITTEDLMAVRDVGDPGSALLERLVRRTDGSAVTTLSPTDQELVDQAAQELAGVAGSVLAVRCPSCGEQNRTAVDPAAWGWERLELWATRQLEEVAALARAYGWTEAEVLALTPSRRARYLELAFA